MGVLSRWTEDGGDGGFHLYCPGCKKPHMVQIGQGSGPRWGFNGDEAKPTFSPSLLVRSGHYAHADQKPGGCYCDAKERGVDPGSFTCGICHSFVRDGMIEFLTDSTHELAGQTVQLPEYPAEWE